MGRPKKAELAKKGIRAGNMATEKSALSNSLHPDLKDLRVGIDPDGRFFADIDRINAFLNKHGAGLKKEDASEHKIDNTNSTEQG
jgi:hypothetical protein